MADHKVYACIVKAIKEGKLVEPFSMVDFKKVCPNFAEGTYKAFLYKHRVGNPGGNSELFKKVSPGNFKLVRPYNMVFKFH